jgi:hypothetical protein
MCKHIEEGVNYNSLIYDKNDQHFKSADTF